MVLDLLVFFGVLAVLVLVHEFGHFLFARFFGVRVDEFGFGFPPRLGGVRRGQTLYSFNLLPLGGFVKIAGEDSVESGDPENFASKSAVQRSLILAAGIAFNALLAYGLFAVALGIGVPVEADDALWSGRIRDARVTAIDVAPNSAAERAGIRLGDAIIALEAVDGKTRNDISISAVKNFMQEHRGETIRVEILRNGATLTLEPQLPETAKPNEGILGIAMARIGVVDSPWWAVPWDALKMTYSTFTGTIKGMAALAGIAASGGSVEGMVSGPIGIFSLVAETLRFGFAYFITLVAALSVNLAIINVIPFPGLDGGRLLFIAIEKIRGRALSATVSRWANGMGFAILILLMVVITYYDIRLRL